MSVLERYQHRLERRQADQLRQERGQRSLHADPGRQRECRIALAAVDPEKLGEQRDFMMRIGRTRFEQRYELGKTRLGTILAVNTGGMLELANDRMKRALGMMGRAEIPQVEAELAGNFVE